MKIKIICFGHLDEKFWLEACQEYQKRLTRFCALEIKEIKESSFTAGLKNQKNDMQNLKDQLQESQDYQVYFLDVEAPLVDSLEFSQLIEKNKNQRGKICFVIGPSNGFSETVKKDYQKISFGSVTIPHQLFRVLLLEQIYRSFKIMNHQKYHK